MWCWVHEAFSHVAGMWRMRWGFPWNTNTLSSAFTTVCAVTFTIHAVPWPQLTLQCSRLCGCLAMYTTFSWLCFGHGPSLWLLGLHAVSDVCKLCRLILLSSKKAFYREAMTECSHWVRSWMGCFGFYLSVTFNNHNNHEYLQRLTCTGPNRLHILGKYRLSKFRAYNINAHTESGE